MQETQSNNHSANTALSWEGTGNAVNERRHPSSSSRSPERRFQQPPEPEAVARKVSQIPVLLHSSKPRSLLAAELEAPQSNGNEDTKEKPAVHPSRPFTGVVVSLSPSGFHAFIDCQETFKQYGRDIYVRKSDLARHGLKLGDLVTFSLFISNEGTPTAKTVAFRNRRTSWRLQGVVGTLEEGKDGAPPSLQVECADVRRLYGQEATIRTALADALGLIAGDAISFEVEFDDDGHPQARAISFLEADSSRYKGLVNAMEKKAGYMTVTCEEIFKEHDCHPCLTRTIAQAHELVAGDAISFEMKVNEAGVPLVRRPKRMEEGPAFALQLKMAAAQGMEKQAWERRRPDNRRESRQRGVKASSDAGSGGADSRKELAAPSTNKTNGGSKGENTKSDNGGGRGDMQSLETSWARETGDQWKARAEKVQAEIEMRIKALPPLKACPSSPSSPSTQRRKKRPREEGAAEEAGKEAGKESKAAKQEAGKAGRPMRRFRQEVAGRSKSVQSARSINSNSRSRNFAKAAAGQRPRAQRPGGAGNDPDLVQEVKQILQSTPGPPSEGGENADLELNEFCARPKCRPKGKGTSNGGANETSKSKSPSNDRGENGKGVADSADEDLISQEAKIRAMLQTQLMEVDIEDLPDDDDDEDEGPQELSLKASLPMDPACYDLFALRVESSASAKVEMVLATIWGR